MPTTQDAVAVTTSHVGINVTDLDRSVAFYTTVLGLAVGRRSDEASRRYAYLTSGGSIVVTLWEQSGASFDPRRAGLHHLAFRLPSAEALTAAERFVRAQGFTVYHDGVVAHGEADGALFFDDPDGTRLEIAAPYADAPEARSDGPTCGFF